MTKRWANYARLPDRSRDGNEVDGSLLPLGVGPTARFEILEES